MGLHVINILIRKINFIQSSLFFLILVQANQVLANSSPNKLLAIQVKKGEITLSKEWTGSVEAEQRVEVNTSSDLVIEKIYVKEGDKVSKGDKLIKINKKSLRKELSDMREQLALKNIDFHNDALMVREKLDNFSRKKILYNKKIISSKEFEQNKNEYEIAKNNLQAKSRDVAKFQKQINEKNDELKSGDFLSPDSGVVTGLIQIKDEAEKIRAGTKILSLSKSEKLVFRCKVEEEYVNRISVGKKTMLKINGVEGAMKEGSVAKIAMQASKEGDSIAKKYHMQVNFTKSSPDIHEGQSGIAQIVFNAKSDVNLIPIAALRDLGGETVVLASSNKNEVPKRKKVEVGLRNDSEVEVVSGLKDHDWVFVDETE